MSGESRWLKDKIKMTEAELSELRGKLEAMQFDCGRRMQGHSWTEAKYTPIIHEGYQDPGDPVGTMGVDRRLPSWVPRQEIPMWKRECTECGKTQDTRHTRDDVKKVPVF